MEGRGANLILNHAASHIEQPFSSERDKNIVNITNSLVLMVFRNILFLKVDLLVLA